MVTHEERYDEDTLARLKRAGSEAAAAGSNVWEGGRHLMAQQLDPPRARHLLRKAKAQIETALSALEGIENGRDDDSGPGIGDDDAGRLGGHCLERP
jgi:hypothetical protein